MLKRVENLIIFLLFTSVAVAQKKTPVANTSILKAASFKHYVDYFNTMEDENIAQAIPNAQAWDWMQQNIPLFECPQQNFEEMFYYRWWTLRKHLKQTPVGYAFDEFLVQRSYADKYNLIACAFGHHLMESRWLHNQQYLNDYVHVWYRGNDGKPMNKIRGFSSWGADAIYNRYLVNKDAAYIKDMLPDLKQNYAEWEGDHRLPNGLFWQTDVKDGMEETISGGRREKNARPTINSYMYANAKAIAAVANMAGSTTEAALYKAKADTLKNLIDTKLWNPAEIFYETLKEKGDTSANVREEIGFIPWYFNLPDNGKSAAWKYITDSKEFLAPFGITTAEQSAPTFMTRGTGKCEWDGAVWPFATSQTLTGMANLLNNYQQNVVGDTTYFKLLETYVESQYYRGRPYIGEYLHPQTGYWLMGDRERSRYYNHSTFNDLIITGLIGLRPRADEVLEVHPLVPQNKWDWFCLDNVLYHGKTIAIMWDKDGTKYKKGKGLSLFVNGRKVANAAELKKIEVKL
jgi:hypothetical protein